MSYARKIGVSFKTFSLGDTGKTGKFNIDVNTNMGIRSAFDAASGIEFPSSAAKWPSCKNDIASV